MVGYIKATFLWWVETQKNSCAKYIFQGLQVGQINLSFFAILFKTIANCMWRTVLQSKGKLLAEDFSFFSFLVVEIVKSGMPIAMHWELEILRSCWLLIYSIAYYALILMRLFSSASSSCHSEVLPFWFMAVLDAGEKNVLVRNLSLYLNSHFFL